MNRRDALAALVSLPEVSRVSLARPQPDDVVVFECDASMRPWTPAQIDAFRAQATRIWPDRRVVVLPPGVRLTFAKDVS